MSKAKFEVDFDLIKEIAQTIHDCSWVSASDTGYRHGRLNPHPLGTLRHRGDQAHVRPREQVRRLPTVLVVRPSRPHDPHRS